MTTAGVSEENSTIERAKNDRTERSNYWKKVVSHYEKRNASLERRQAALVERVRFMECALPSLLMGAVVGGKRVPEVSKNKLYSCSHPTSKQSCACSSSSYASHKMSLVEANEVGIKMEDIRRCRMQNEAKP